MTALRRLAILGFGRLGQACARALQGDPELRVVGIVRRPGGGGKPIAGLSHIPVVAHVRELSDIDAVLLCLPPTMATAAACEVIRLTIPLVECARLEGGALNNHYRAIDHAARLHRVAAMVGAGWDPGMLGLIRHAFDILIPKGRTALSLRPGTALHHSEAAGNLPGVVGAVEGEFPSPEGSVTRYVYAQLEKNADPAAIQASLDADPLYGGERTLFFSVPSIDALEDEGQGVLLERRGSAPSGAHPGLLLEARFDAAAFAAQVMRDAAGQLAGLAPGAHRYRLATQSD